MMNANKTINSSHNQSGAALAMALTILVILTLLGVSAMKSSSLEIKMATGLQDHTMVFQAADSGLAYALVNAGLDLNGATSTTYTPSSGITAQVTTSFSAYSPPERGSGYSAVDYRTANFEQTSVATIPSSGAKSTVHQGISKLLRK